MSYRAFKRLLGETSLERKCRFLFGGFILLLITGSFWIYARQTEYLAYDQLQTAGRLLVNQIVSRQIATKCRYPDADATPRATEPVVAVMGASTAGPFSLAGVAVVHPQVPIELRRTQAIDQLRQQGEENWPLLKEYKFRIILPNARQLQNKPEDDYEQQRLREFLNNDRLTEDSQLLLARNQHHYYGAVRATPTCIACHAREDPQLREGGLIAMVKINMTTRLIEEDVHKNRAILISTALGTALLIMGGSYLIVRYVIVKPVKHLKEVSDAISAGELNVRSEIQTGDEFEDLSHAFNRMLRNLVAMQDRLRKVNADLDRKVDELAQANLALFESNRLKGDFLATMSHELRTPLNSILGFSEVLLAGQQLAEKQQRWVRNVQSSGERLLALINDILDLAKIEAGKMDVRISEFSVSDVCEGMLTMFRPLAEKKNIDLRCQIDSNVPPLRQDLGKVQQILSNLLSNAVKFTPEGGRVQLRAALVSPPLDGQRDPGREALAGHFGEGGSAHLAPREVLLIVSDTGVGITPEEQELVFEKFRQGANPLTRQHEGTGLGLSISRELTKLLGGEITLQSELGRGSTFTVRLPIQLTPEPRLEFDLSRESIDLSKAQRIDARLYAAPKEESL